MFRRSTDHFFPNLLYPFFAILVKRWGIHVTLKINYLSLSRAQLNTLHLVVSIHEHKLPYTLSSTHKWDLEWYVPFFHPMSDVYPYH